MSNDTLGSVNFGPTFRSSYLLRGRYLSQLDSLKTIKETEAELKKAEEIVKHLQDKLNRAKETELETRQQCDSILECMTHEDRLSFILEWSENSHEAVLELAKGTIKGETRGDRAETPKDGSIEL